MAEVRAFLSTHGEEQVRAIIKEELTQSQNVSVNKDLLVALEGVVVILEAYPVWRDWPDTVIARAAIARAKGV